LPRHNFARRLETALTGGLCYSPMKQPRELSILVSALSISLTISSCDRMITSRHAQVVKDADAKAAQGDFSRAVNLYEAALDDSPQCAEVHYKLALLYDDKLKDPLNALHHFKRYLILAPNGPHANDVRNSVKRDEVDLLTSLSGDTVLPRAEAARLRNENLNLRKELEERRIPSHGTIDKSAPTKTSGETDKAIRTYIVRSGDTLASISRKFYKTSRRWKKILDANRKSIDNPETLKIGQTLVIP
jgi:LysM repeat protein